jgi:hypothetical protein
VSAFGVRLQPADTARAPKLEPPERGLPTSQTRLSASHPIATTEMEAAAQTAGP